MNFSCQGVMWLRFVTEYCNKVEYVIKIDDDVVVNLHDLVALIYAIRENPSKGDDPKRMIIGTLGKNDTVPRDKRSKW